MIKKFKKIIKQIATIAMLIVILFSTNLSVKGLTQEEFESKKFSSVWVEFEANLTLEQLLDFIREYGIDYGLIYTNFKLAGNENILVNSDITSSLNSMYSIDELTSSLKSSLTKEITLIRQIKPDSEIFIKYDKDEYIVDLMLSHDIKIDHGLFFVNREERNILEYTKNVYVKNMYFDKDYETEVLKFMESYFNYRQKYSENPYNYASNDTYLYPNQTEEDDKSYFNKNTQKYIIYIVLSISVIIIAILLYIISKTKNHK